MVNQVACDSNAPSFQLTAAHIMNLLQNQTSDAIPLLDLHEGTILSINPSHSIFPHDSWIIDSTISAHINGDRLTQLDCAM